MSEIIAATPAENQEPTPTTPPAATPAPVAPVATPNETVTLTKEEADQLRRDAARAGSNQRKADLYDRTIGKGNHFGKTAAPVTPPTDEEASAAATLEDRKAERGLLALAFDTEYREIIDKDPTLKDLLQKNPLAVLPILAPDAIDADDAISLVKEALGKRKTAAAAPSQLPETPPAPATPATPPAGGINPPAVPVNEEVEAARKLPNTEQAIGGMLKARLKQAGTK